MTMDIEYADMLLSVLIENSVRIFAAGFGVNCAEATLFQIVDLVREHPELKESVLRRVACALRVRDPGTLNPAHPPRELIVLLSHEFRWPELRELARHRTEVTFHGDLALAAFDISHEIVEAQNDDWEDREFYPRYAAKTSGG